MAQRRQEPVRPAPGDGAATAPVLPLAGAAALLGGFRAWGPLWFVGLVLAVIGLGFAVVSVQELLRVPDRRWRIALPVGLSVFVLLVLVASL